MLNAVNSLSTASSSPWTERTTSQAKKQGLQSASSQNDGDLHAAFDQFVGESLYGQMLKSLRASQHKPAYFYGGRGEEVFQQQLDQLLAEKMSKANAATFAEPMFELSSLARR